MSTEMDITIIDSNFFNDAYFIINFICDLFNYVVFVIICVVIDICMVIPRYSIASCIGKENKENRINETKARQD